MLDYKYYSAGAPAVHLHFPSCRGWFILKERLKRFMNNFMNDLKQFASLSGLLGLFGGSVSFVITILLLLVRFHLLPYFFGYLGYFVFLFRLAILALGIVGLVKFKEDTRVPSSAHILFIVSFVLSLIFGLAGDICMIIGGYIYLNSLKSFDSNSQNPSQFF